jgi:parallel beta-helix repeat protein
MRNISYFSFPLIAALRGSASALCILLSLAVAAQAQTTITIGEQHILSSGDGANANTLIAQETTLTQTATINNLSFYVTNAAGKLILGIYDATGPNGGPGKLKAKTNTFTPVKGWNNINVATPVSLTKGNYWLSYLPNSNNLSFVKQNTSGSCWYYGHSFSSGMPATWGSKDADGCTPTTWSFYATLTTSGSTSSPPPVAVNGVCGSSNGATLSTTPTNLRSTGTASTVSGTGPWSWSCAGSNGGTNASCSAQLTPQAPAPVNGICGTANGTTVASKPTTNLCSTGTSSTVSGTGPWTWSCAGRNGGATASCSAQLTPPTPVNGVCGTSNGTTVASKPTNNLCNTGTASTVAGTGPWTSSCSGANGGTNASCSAQLAPPPPVNGVCGSSNGTTLSTTPTNLCNTGTSSALAGSGPWSWTCIGSNGGTTASCSAQYTPPAPQTGEVPGPSADLYNKPFYTCVRNFYVSTTGNDANAGTLASPWRTIQNADSTARQPGDCINVAPGTYNDTVTIEHGGNAPTAIGYVAYRCQTLDGCHILAPGAGHLWGFANAGNYVVVDGFELDGNNALQTDGIADACIDTDDFTYGGGNSSYQAGAAAHHIWVLNNIIHHCNLAGISLSGKEWYYSIHNTVYHNAWTSGFQGSGIGYVVVQCIEAGGKNCYTSGIAGIPASGYSYVPSGNDVTFNPPAGYDPFHNVVAWNDVYDNRIASYNSIGCGNHTDGNGIIMDTFQDMFTNTLDYPYQTLVMYNTSHGNGGRGIHVFITSNTTVANNTVYGNGTDNCIPAVALGDLSQQGGANNVWVDNIAQTVQSPANSKCQYCGGSNAPLATGNVGSVVDLNNTYSHNILYGGIGVQLYDNDVTYFSNTPEQVGVDPHLVNPAGSNFALQPNSTAIGYGATVPYLLPASDVGACPSASATCP